MPPTRRFVVKVPLVLGHYFEGEIINADHHSRNWNDLMPLITVGDIVELTEGAPIPSDPRLATKLFSIKSTPDKFADYVTRLWTGLPENPILPQFLDKTIGRYKFPLGSGYLSLGPPPGLNDRTLGYKELAFHGLYHGLSDEQGKALRREAPVAFRIVDLTTGYIRVQARCAAPVAKPYFDELLKRLATLWPEVTWPYPVPGNPPGPPPAASSPFTTLRGVSNSPSPDQTITPHSRSRSVKETESGIPREIVGVILGVATNVVATYLQANALLLLGFIGACFVLWLVFRHRPNARLWGGVLLGLLISFVLLLVLVNQPSSQQQSGPPSPRPPSATSTLATPGVTGTP